MIKSNLGFVLQYLYGGEGIKPRHRTMDRLFSDLLALLANDWERMVLRRFFYFCTKIGVNPLNIGPDIYAQYREYLFNATLAANPIRNLRLLERIWNKYSRDCPAWPQVQLTVPRNPPPAISITSELEADLAQYSAFLHGSLLHPERHVFIVTPLAPSSILQHTRALRRCAVVARASGLGPRSIAELGQHSTTIRDSMAQAEQSRSPGHAHRQMLELKLAMLRWTSAAEIPLQRPSPLIADNAVCRSAATKFQQIYHFIESDLLGPLLSLPEQLMARAAQYDVGHPKRRAQSQVALGLEILLMVPITPAQLTNLRIGVSLLEVPGANKVTILVHPAKAPHRELEYDLPDRSLKLLQEYRKVIVPAIKIGPLFRSDGGLRRQTAAFSRAISDNILRYIGLWITPRALRFLGPSLYLMRYPDDYETVRQAMAHTSADHTRRMFRYVKVVRSVRNFDSLVKARAASGAPRRATYWTIS